MASLHSFQTVSPKHGVLSVEFCEDIHPFKSQVVYEDLGSTFGSFIGDSTIDTPAWTSSEVELALR